MIKAVIVDDEVDARELLEVIIIENCPSIKVCALTSCVAEAREAIEKFKPNIVFLDIELKGESGFDLFNHFSEINFSVIFVTAYDQYAVRAFRQNAIDYLLKPVDEEDLIASVNKLETWKSKKDEFQESVQRIVKDYTSHTISSDEQIAVGSVEGFEFVKIKNIIRCEADGRYTHCFLMDDQNVISSKTISEFEKSLSKYDFIRVHHGHLINPNFIKKYHKGTGGQIVMTDGSIVPVAKRKKDAFLKLLNKI